MFLASNTLDELCVLRKRHLAQKTPLAVSINDERDLIQGAILETGGGGGTGCTGWLAGLVFHWKPSGLTVLAGLAVLSILVYYLLGASVGDLGANTGRLKYF